MKVMLCVIGLALQYHCRDGYCHFDESISLYVIGSEKTHHFAKVQCFKTGNFRSLNIHNSALPWPFSLLYKSYQKACKEHNNMLHRNQKYMFKPSCVFSQILSHINTRDLEITYPCACSSPALLASNSPLYW